MKAIGKSMSRALSAARYLWKGMSKAAAAFMEASKPGAHLTFYK